jgi:hypothetical protein
MFEGAFTIARHSLYSGIFIKIRISARPKNCSCVGSQFIFLYTCPSKLDVY